MKDGNFEIGDKVRFVDNELNRAEISKSARNATLEVAGYVSANRIGLRELECYYYHGRFELVPQYQVGDWVEVLERNGDKTWTSQRKVVTIYKSGDGYGVDFHGEQPVRWDGAPFSLISLGFVKVIRKLSPAEVVISIGCLKGTVEKREGNPRAFNLVDGLTNSAIHLDMLDSNTHKLVTELLKAQEEA